MANPLLIPLTPALSERAGGVCELCGGAEGLLAREVGPSDLPRVERAILECQSCRTEPVDSRHWFCLQESVWSEVPAVQVAAYRLLHGISASWATEQIEGLYIDDALLDWARQELADPDAPVARDSHGAELVSGDSVTLIKDLAVKGAGFTAKRGTLVRGIRTGDDPGLVEGRVKGTVIYLKTEFLKKA